MSRKKSRNVFLRNVGKKHIFLAITYEFWFLVILSFFSFTIMGEEKECEHVALVGRRCEGACGHRGRGRCLTRFLALVINQPSECTSCVMREHELLFFSSSYCAPTTSFFVSPTPATLRSFALFVGTDIIYEPSDNITRRHNYTSHFYYLCRARFLCYALLSISRAPFSVEFICTSISIPSRKCVIAFAETD